MLPLPHALPREFAKRLADFLHQTADSVGYRLEGGALVAFDRNQEWLQRLLQRRNELVKAIDEIDDTLESLRGA